MAHTLLLADDSLAIQRVVELTFAAEDIRVVAVGDGQQAIERLTAERPDIVLADIAMPLADGYAVAEFVRATPAISDVPVLLLAGAFDIVEESRLGASGARGVLVKPFEPHVVISRVKELLGLGPSKDAPPAPAESARLLTPREPPRPPRTLAADPPFWRDPVAADGAPRAVPAHAAEGAHARQASAPAAAVSAPAPASREVASADAAEPPARAVAPAPAAVSHGGGAAAAVSQGGSAAGAAPHAVTASPAPVIDEHVLSALVDRIAARVVEQLGARLHDEVTGLVLDTSERLVREEIARIRNAARANDAS